MSEFNPHRDDSVQEFSATKIDEPKRITKISLITGQPICCLSESEFLRENEISRNPHIKEFLKIEDRFSFIESSQYIYLNVKKMYKK